MSYVPLTAIQSRVFSGCRISKAADTTVSNITDTFLAFDTEVYDTDAYHDLVTNTGRITIPTGLGGKFDIKWQGRIATPAAADSEYEGYIRKNGTTYLGVDRTSVAPNKSGGTSPVLINLTLIGEPLVATDYVEFGVYHDSGASRVLLGSTNLSYSSLATLVRVG